MYAALLAVSLTSCAFRYGPPALRTPPPARPDEVYWSDVRDAVAEAEVPSVVGKSTLAWALPFFGFFDEITADASRDHVEAETLGVVNLGLLVFPALPLWVDGSHLSAEPGRPTRARWSALWTPLWATSSAEPDAETFYDVSGFPLLYTRLEAVEPGVRDVWYQGLWTLGPGFGHGRSDTSDERYWMAVPVFAGGLGLLAWISTESHSPDEHLVAHGPAGALWFDTTSSARWTAPRTFLHDDVRDRDEVARTHLRAVLAGALWFELEALDADGAVIDGLYGPLWGLLGGGRDADGEPFMSLFWFRIPL